jgi:cell wall-associated NlpC family hydrolase
MQGQFVGNGNAAPSRSVAAIALCASVLWAAQARAQVTVGSVKVDVTGDARSSAAARSILTAIGIAERVSRGRRERAGSKGGGPETSRGKSTPAPAPRAPAASAARVLPTAERYLGVPYRWGGTSPKTGFDCSGFVQYVFAKHGTRLPRTSRQMASSGQRLRPVWSALRPGDLVMFAESGKRISHVAIYAGSRRIIHATSSGRRVRYDALDTKRGQWFAERIVAARRVSPRGAALVRSLLERHPLGDTSRLELDTPDGAPPPNDGG